MSICPVKRSFRSQTYSVTDYRSSISLWQVWKLNPCVPGIFSTSIWKRHQKAQNCRVAMECITQGSWVFHYDESIGQYFSGAETSGKFLFTTAESSLFNIYTASLYPVFTGMNSASPQERLASPRSGEEIPSHHSSPGVIESLMFEKVSKSKIQSIPTMSHRPFFCCLVEARY